MMHSLTGEMAVINLYVPYNLALIIYIKKW